MTEQGQGHDDVPERIQRLEDYIAISELKARYLRAIDSHDWSLLESVFAPDASVTLLTGAVSRGGAAFAERVGRVLGEGWSSHHGHTPELSIDGDTASGIWAMEDYLGLPSGQGVRGYGHYTETYSRTPGGWRIAATSMTRLREETEEAKVRPAFTTEARA
jgi:hypothetical protein